MERWSGEEQNEQLGWHRLAYKHSELHLGRSTYWYLPWYPSHAGLYILQVV